MPLTVLLVSGPRRAGKSTVIQQIIAHGTKHPPHYLRLTSATGDKRPPMEVRPAPAGDCGVATAQWIEYEQDRVFEFLPAALQKIHRRDRRGIVIIEADSDPILRHAYPYDYRLFIIPAPQRTSEIFRTGTQAADAFKAALHDTAAFAGEIFGLLESGDPFDIGEHEARSTLTSAEMRVLMNSSLGRELATRILLQPSHHGLLESDILVVNTAVGGMSGLVDECVHRLERVLANVYGPEGGRHLFFSCDPADPEDPLRLKLLDHVAAMLSGEFRRATGKKRKSTPSEPEM